MRLSKRWKKVVTIGLVLVACGLATHAFWSWRADVRLQNRLAAIRDAGRPTSLSELERPRVDATENAARLLRQANTGMDAIEQAWFKLEEKNENETLWESPTPEQLAAMRENFRSHAEVIPLLQDASRCADFVAERDYSLLPSAFLEAFLDQASSNRSPFRTLNFHVIVAVAGGELGDAREDCLAGLRLARHVTREPTFVGYLVSLACRSVALSMTERVLLAGDSPPEFHKLVDAELERLESMPGFQFAFESEQALVISNYREQTGIGTWLGGWYFKNDLCNVLEILDSQLKLGDSPSYQIKAKLEAWKQEAAGHGRLAASLAPAILAVREAMNRSLAQVRCLRILNAIHDQGVESLDELSQLSLPDATLVDPYDGKSLRWKLSPKGWTIYSVGTNGVDDGGSIDDIRDVGFGVNVP